MCLPLLNCLNGAGPYPGVGSGCRGRGRGHFSTLSVPWGGLFHSNDLRILSTVYASFRSSIRLLDALKIHINSVCIIITVYF